MGDKEDAVAAVEAAFHDAHRSAEKALIDATQLLQHWLKACREIGFHPNYSSETTMVLGEALHHLTGAVAELGTAHRYAAADREEAVSKNLLPPSILPQGGGGGGKTWP